MKKINERLKEAAGAGSEVELEALLREPGCDALAQNGDGLTALMHAAYYGQEGCVRLLLPVSNALAQDGYGMTALMCASRYGREGCVQLLLPASEVSAQDRRGRTASAWARNCKHESLAQFIDAYDRAQSEREALGVAASLGAPRGRAALRV